MTKDERFELLWDHYHRQVDENRYVNRTLDEIRQRLRELESEFKAGAN